MMNKELDFLLVREGKMDIYDFVEKYYESLFDKYCDQMPYGIAKARTGDPIEWLVNKLEESM